MNKIKVKLTGTLEATYSTVIEVTEDEYEDLKLWAAQGNLDAALGDIDLDFKGSDNIDVDWIDGEVNKV